MFSIVWFAASCVEQDVFQSQFVVRSGRYKEFLGASGGDDTISPQFLIGWTKKLLVLCQPLVMACLFSGCPALIGGLERWGPHSTAGSSIGAQWG